MMPIRRILASTACATLAALGSLGPGRASAQDQDKVQLNALFMQQAAYSEEDIRSMTRDFQKEHPNVTVNLEFVAYEALHDKIVIAQGAGAQGYDVVLFDVVWPAEFAENNVLRKVTDRIPDSYDDKVLPGAWTTVTYDDERYGLPWIVDTKYLFYNEKMMKEAGIDEVPRTWSGLLDAARTIKDKGIVDYPIVWSWAQAEALICDYTTLVSAYDGSFFSSDGEPVFQTDGGLDALKYMNRSLDDGLTNPNSVEYLEEDVRRVFSSGQAAFALNWTYMYNLANDPSESQVAGNVRIAPAPGVDGKSEVSAVNGSMGLGITTTSEHPDAAWSYIEYLTSQPVQNQYAKLSLPIWKTSYDDPKVTEGQEPLVDAAKKSLAAMYPRPTISRYQEFSTELQKSIQRVLLDQEDPEPALERASSSAERLMR